MSETTKLLDEYCQLYSSDENARRSSCWTRLNEGIRWENQWHGLPAYTVDSGNPMPVTAECLDAIWEDILGLEQKKYFTDPDCYLEFYLKMRIEKFKRLPDDTPLTMDIPLVFGVTHEAGMLGQKIFFNYGEEPTFARESIVDENTAFPKEFNFNKNDYLDMVVPFYRRLKERTGSDFRVIFPHWYRAPQGVALYIRGFQEFSLDLYINEPLARRILRYATDAAKAYALWRQDFTGEPIHKCDLFNDDIPLMSPEMYTQYFFEYEKELSDFHGGVFYWHSCGDTTSHIAAVHALPDIDLLDFGVTMEDKADGLRHLARKQTVEFRVMAQKHIQQCSEEESKDYIRKIIESCKEYSVSSYIIRSSGMSIVHGSEKDLQMLGRWVDLVREVQEES